MTCKWYFHLTRAEYGENEKCFQEGIHVSGHAGSCLGLPRVMETGVSSWKYLRAVLLVSHPIEFAATKFRPVNLL